MGLVRRRCFQGRSATSRTRSESKPQGDGRSRASLSASAVAVAGVARAHYLVDDPDTLAAQTDRYLFALSERAIISTQLRDLALRVRLQPLKRAPAATPENFVENKAANTVRVGLLPLLGVSSTYD